MATAEEQPKFEFRVERIVMRCKDSTTWGCPKASEDELHTFQFVRTIKTYSCGENRTDDWTAREWLGDQATSEIEVVEEPNANDQELCKSFELDCSSVYPEKLEEAPIKDVVLFMAMTFQKKSCQRVDGYLTFACGAQREFCVDFVVKQTEGPELHAIPQAERTELLAGTVLHGNFSKNCKLPDLWDNVEFVLVLPDGAEGGGRLEVRLNDRPIDLAEFVDVNEIGPLYDSEFERV